jgi:hypothetical protein
MNAKDALRERAVAFSAGAQSTIQTLRENGVEIPDELGDPAVTNSARGIGASWLVFCNLPVNPDAPMVSNEIIGEQMDALGEGMLCYILAMTKNKDPYSILKAFNEGGTP